MKLLAHIAVLSFCFGCYGGGSKSTEPNADDPQVPPPSNPSGCQPVPENERSALATADVDNYCTLRKQCLDLTCTQEYRDQEIRQRMAGLKWFCAGFSRKVYDCEPVCQSQTNGQRFGSDESCEENALTSFDPNWVSSRSVKLYNEIASRCGGRLIASYSDIDDEMLLFVATTDDSYNRLKQCAENQCADIEACLRTAAGI